MAVHVSDSAKCPRREAWWYLRTHLVLEECHNDEANPWFGVEKGHGAFVANVVVFRSLCGQSMPGIPLDAGMELVVEAVLMGHGRHAKRGPL